MPPNTLFSKINPRLLPFAVMGLFIAAALIVFNNPPSTGTNGARQAATFSVEITPITPAPYTIILDSYGVVRPRTQTTLFPQVSGQIVSVNGNFREGGFFEENDILVTIDDRDFRANVTAAQASLLEAESLLLEEQAQAKISERDWRRSGNTQQAPDLVLRKPQLKAAEARLKSAQATLQTAELNLERTRIRAPFAGRALSKNVDLGQLVSSNIALGDIYATDYIEVRLPLKNQDLAYIDLPENYRMSVKTASLDDAALPAKPSLPTVTISSNLINQQQWIGNIVRVESAIDSATQQLHVIAQIEDPYSASIGQKTPLKIGQYVTATINGKTVSDAIVIPNSTIYQGSYVYIVTDDVIERRNIQVAWRNSREALIERGLSEGDALVVTPLGQIISGTPVNIINQPTNTSTDS